MSDTYYYASTAAQAVRFTCERAQKQSHIGYISLTRHPFSKFCSPWVLSLAALTAAAVAAAVADAAADAAGDVSNGYCSDFGRY
jgi:hypothetical protein